MSKCEHLKKGSGIWEASRDGHVQCVKKLLKKGASPNVVYGTTPLIVACENGHVACVERLLAAGADVNSWVYPERVTALLVAVQNNAPECLDLLIVAGADLEHKGVCGETALLRAALDGLDSCVHSLLKAGADVNTHCTRSEYNGTALLLATLHQHHKCVDLLIEGGADLNKKTQTGPLADETALELAIKKGDKKSVDMLVNGGACMKPSDANRLLARAVSRGNLTLVQTFMDVGADPDVAVNELDDFHGSKLRISGRFIRTLLEAGVDVNVRLMKHGSLLNRVCELSDEKFCVMELLKAGAKVNQDGRHGYGKPVLRCKNPEVRKILLSAGEKPRDDWGRSLFRKTFFENMEMEDPEIFLMSLMNTCREQIRELMLDVSDVNLFVRVPELGLPSMLEDYLLYNVKLYSGKKRAVKPRSTDKKVLQGRRKDKGKKSK